jgi:hypothetical protein
MMLQERTPVNDLGIFSWKGSVATMILCVGLVLIRILFFSYTSVINQSRLLCSFNMNCVHCRHGMARPRVANGEDNLKIWRTAANILNKQSRIAEKG